MSLSAYALVTLEDAKDYLNITASSDDVAIERLVNAASSFVDKETGRNIFSRTYTDEVYSGTGSALLRLRNFPVTSVTEINFLLSDAPETWETQSLTSYPVTILPETGSDTIMYRNWAFPKGPANVQVTYVAGYTATTMPDALKEVTLQAIAYLWKKKDTLRAGIASQSFQGQTTSYILDLKKAVDMSLLDPYCRYAF